MPKELETLLKNAPLIYVDDGLPGISRRRAGKGWSYRDAHGERIADRAEIDRLNAIALPPAYVDAWFCPAANGHILATGIDARGRKQYRYHPDFRAIRDEAKFGSLVEFAQFLPLVRKRVAEDLKSPELTRERAVASVVRLLDTGRIRIGNKRYSKTNGSFGASTLRMKHVKLKGKELRLRFRAKSGKLREMRVTDGSLSRFVKQMQDLPGQNLFQFLDDEGHPHPVASHDVNAYLRETMGGPYTAKHFRTWHASVIAFQSLAEAKDRMSIKAVMEIVSDRLGNTPTIARNSYVHPAITALIDDQEAWREELSLPRKTQWLTRYERATTAFLEQGAPEKLRQTA